MHTNRPSDMIQVADARKILGVSTVKMAQLLREGVLRAFNDPLDKRVKLVSLAEIETLLNMRGKAA